MSAHRDILDERVAMKRPFAGSLALHLAVFLSAAAYNWLEGRPRDSFGDPNALGGVSTVITPVSKIPLPPKTGLVNPVANDTESMAPTPPKPEPKTQQDDRKAIELATKKNQDEAKKKTQASKNTYKNPIAERPNQVYAREQAAVTPMYDQNSSGSGVGMGQSNPFGNRFGYYANIIRERVAQAWKPNQQDPRARALPPVILTFSIYRDGRAGDIRVIQSSGNPTLDYSAQRAILEASPFPPLPQGFERNSASIEFQFQLKR